MRISRNPKKNQKDKIGKKAKIKNDSIENLPAHQLFYCQIHFEFILNNLIDDYL